MTLHRSRILLSTFSAKHSVDVDDSVVNAFENVQRFLADPSEQKLTPRVLEKMCGLYERYKGFDDSVLEEKLETSGVWIPGPDWYNKGRTLDEAVLLLIYTSRNWYGYCNL